MYVYMCVYVCVYMCACMYKNNKDFAVRLWVLNATVGDNESATWLGL